jgi:outer membrane protein OmpU
MNNIKKIGFTALAGSLAMVSANAVDYTMTGGLTSTYSVADNTNNVAADTGRGFGVATDLGFTAAGELDNGYTVTMFMSLDTNAAVTNTSSQLTVGMGSLGTLQLNNIAGAKANGIDDITPNAYNEVWDGMTGSAAINNPSFFGSATASGSLDYRIPAQSYEGMTVNASVTYDPNAGVGGASKGGVVSTGERSGVAYTLQIAHESGFEIGGGHESVDAISASPGSHGVQSATGYVKYATGGLSVAYQESYLDSAAEQGGTATAGAADKESVIYSVAYTSGDMTVSYGEAEVDTNAIGSTAALSTVELSSIQAAYTMGAMTISAAISQTDNEAGVAAQEYTENQLAISFAF